MLLNIWTKGDVTGEVLHSGLRLSTMVDGYYFSRLYIGYSRREAERIFKQEIKELSK